MSVVSIRDIIIPIITAVIGGTLAGIPSYIGFKVKRLELEYAYKVRLENRIYENSIEQLNTLYKPIYSLLNSYESSFQVEADKLNEVYAELLERCKVVLEKDERMFMPEVIEIELLAMKNFLAYSLKKNEIIVGIKQNVEILGFTSSKYKEEEYKSEKDAERRVFFLKLMNTIYFISSLFAGFYLKNTLLKNGFEIYYKSTVIGSEIFYKQMNTHTQTLKRQIKSIMVGNIE